MIKLTLIIQTEDCIRYSINESKVPYSFFYRLSTIFSPSSILLSSYDFLRVKFLELCSFCRRILKLPDGCKLHCWKHVLLQVIHISLKRPESDGKYNQLKPSPVTNHRRKGNVCPAAISSRRPHWGKTFWVWLKAFSTPKLSLLHPPKRSLLA